MDDSERTRLVARASRPNNLSSNDLHELKSILRVNLRPFSDDLRRLMSRSESDDDALILKVALQGTSSLSSNDKHRLSEATTKRGRRLL